MSHTTRRGGGGGGTTMKKKPPLQPPDLLGGQMLAAAFLLLALAPYPASLQWQKDSEEVRCPSFIDNPNCECAASTDGLDFVCDGANLNDFKTIISAARFAIKTLDVASLDSNVTCLCEKIFSNGSVSELKISMSKLSSIDEHAFEAPAVRLHTLIVQNSFLSTLPRAVGKVSSLRRLDLEANEIKEIHAYTFFGPSKLSFINLKDNMLTSLAENAFLGLENNLRELNLMNNQFKSFPMSAVKILKKLQSLNMAGNAIENITSETFTRLDSLKFLDLSSNSFSRIARDTFLSSPNIQRLSVASNSLVEVEPGALDALHDLETLDLSHNSLSQLPVDAFSKTSRLTSVDLSHNRLKQIPNIFVDLYALEEVFLNDNLLLSFTSSWFSNTPNLKIVHLENNVLVEMSENALQPLKRLTQIFLGHNFLALIGEHHFKYNAALTTISIDNNHIAEIHPEAFSGVPKLRELKLQNNILREISHKHFAELPALTELHLQDNKIVFVEPQSFTKLESIQHLDLTGNRLVKVEDCMMRYPSSLRSIYLDQNKLTSFHDNAFAGQTTAEILSLSNNKLERIPHNIFMEFINLFRLNLSRNKILEIDDNAFVAMHQLRYLDVSHNRLSVLTPLTLRGLQQAETVDLSHNRITLIESEAFTGFHHLKHLDLSDNRLKTLKSGAFRSCLTLKTLLLNGAGVKIIHSNALSDFKVLQELDLRNNELTVPDSIKKLEVLTTMKSLLLSGNDLSNMSRVANLSLLNLNTMENLERLELEDANLSNLSSHFIAKNTKLNVIKLGGNKLSRLETAFFRNQVFLKELHLDRNHFSSVPSESLMYLFNLVSLNLSGNRLAQLGESHFDNVGGLKQLDLSHNGMTSISERAFHNVTGLHHLDIGHNQLTQFTTRTFVPLVQLKTFTARDNRLPYIPVAVQGIRKVEVLNFEGNPCQRLKEIPESRAVMLTVREVLITRTNLTTIAPNDFDLFPFLVKLDLKGNQLSRIAPYAFRSLNKLESLDLSHNDIIHLSRERLFGLFALRTLNLSRNHLGSLDAFPPDLSGLALLDVSFNRLRSVARDSLKHLTGLIRLDLRGNLLAMLFPEVFQPLASIRAIDLGHNQFTAVPLEQIKTAEDTLEGISLEGNPLTCSCQSYSQKTWLRVHRKWLDTDRRGSKVGPQCNEPEAIKDRHLLTVKDSELCPLPSVSSLAYNSRDPYNFLVTWKSPDTNMTGLKGFIVAYHRLDRNDQVRKYRVGPTVRGFRIQTVVDNTLYLVCVITRGSSYSSEDGNVVEDEVLGEGDEDEDEDEINDDAFYVMPLEWTRSERDVNQDGIEFETVEDQSPPLDPFGFGALFPGGKSPFAKDINDPEDNSTFIDFDSYPSSNETELLVSKPAVVNLGSQSSKCIQIRTPPDPAKLSLIDNKRMSVVIGCGMGLMVFICIIISIVTAKPKNKDEDIVVGDSSVASSHKSPNVASQGGTKASRTNSMSTADNKELLELVGADGNTMERMKKDRSQTNINSGTLGRRSGGRVSRQVSGDGANKELPEQINGDRRNTKDHRREGGGGSSRHQRHFAKQSSTDSRRSSSESTTLRGHSRQNSDGGFAHDTRVHVRSHGATGGPPGGQSWHGTPRSDHRRSYEIRNESYSTTFPRRNAELHRLNSEGLCGSGMSLDTAGGILSKRRSDPCHLEGSSSSIPLIEYHLVDATKDPPMTATGRGPPPPPTHFSSRPPPGITNPSYVSGPPPSSQPRWNGARPKGSTPPVMRSNTFAGGNAPGGGDMTGNHVGHMRPNHVAAAATLQSPLAVTATSNMDDLESIDYYPDVPGAPLPLARAPPGSSPNLGARQGANRSYIKYNSFANY